MRLLGMFVYCTGFLLTIGAAGACDAGVALASCAPWAVVGLVLMAVGGYCAQRA